MKRLKLFILAAAIILSTNVAKAQSTRIGIGIILGSPTGFSMKFKLNRINALAFNAGWSFGHDEKLHLTGDYLFHFPEAFPESPDFVPYVGLGGRFIISDPGEDKLGVRFGGGLEYTYEPFGFFLELFPVINIIPKTDFDLEGGIGARIYFPIKTRRR